MQIIKIIIRFILSLISKRKERNMTDSDKKAKVNFKLNVTKILTDKKTGKILSQKKSSNGIENEFFYAAMRAAASGIFAPSGHGEDRSINYIGFEIEGLGGAEAIGNRPSDDMDGVDLIDGGDGTKAIAIWTAYVEPSETTTYISNSLGFNNGSAIRYATDTDNQEVTNAQRYTIEWEITASEAV